MILENEFLTTDDVLLVPKYGQLHSRSQAKLKPFIYSAPMDTVTGTNLTTAMLELGEFPVVCRFLEAEYIECLRRYVTNPNCFFAVGALDRIGDFIDAVQLIDSESPLPEGIKISVAVDVAHGDSVVAEETIRFLRSQSFIGHIMSGSIATPDGAIRSLEWGCTHIRIGVGGGCFEPDAEILTSEGKKKISNIVEGDLVLTHLGNFRKVEATTSYLTDENLIEINGTGSTFLHEYYVVSKELVEIVNEDNIHQYARWIPAEELTEDYFLVELSPE